MDKQPTNQGLIPGRERASSQMRQDRMWGQGNLLFFEYWVSFPGDKRFGRYDNPFLPSFSLVLISMTYTWNISSIWGIFKDNTVHNVPKFIGSEMCCETLGFSPKIQTISPLGHRE